MEGGVGKKANIIFASYWYRHFDKAYYRYRFHGITLYRYYFSTDLVQKGTAGVGMFSYSRFNVLRLGWGSCMLLGAEDTRRVVGRKHSKQCKFTSIPTQAQQSCTV